MGTQNMANPVRSNRRALWLRLVLLLVLAAVLFGLWRWWVARQRASRSLGPAELKLDALVLLQSGDPAAVQRAKDVIAAQGGSVFDAFPPRVLLASLPPAADALLLGQDGILAIHRKELDAETLSAVPDVQVAAGVWNRMLQRSFRSELSTQPPPQQMSGEQALVGPEELREVEEPLRASDLPTREQTSEYMVGSVGLDVFLLESNGKLDPNSEDWTPAQRNQVAEEIVAGANWWLQTAIANNRPSPNLSFVFDFHDPWNAPGVVSTRYEPISRSWQDVSLAINEVMANAGYTERNWIAAVRRYVDDQRRAQATDWRVAVFVINSAHDLDGAFADHAFAFSYLNGPALVLTYDCSLWGVDSMEMVFAHELAHSFGALDEYAQSGFQATDTSGYLNVVNSNSEMGHAVEDSLMRSPLSLLRAYREHLISTPVRGMLGWLDADGDGLYDAFGLVRNQLKPTHPNPLRSSNVAYTDPQQRAWVEAWRWQDQSRWANSTGITHVPVSINPVHGVEYRVDGGAWQPATPQDGSFDSSDERYSFAVSGLADGMHSVESAVVNSWHAQEALATDTFYVVLGEATPTPPAPTSTPTTTPAAPTPPSPTATPGPSATAVPPGTATPVAPTITPAPTRGEPITVTLQDGLWDYTGCADTRISAEVPNTNLSPFDLKVGAKQKLASLLQFNLGSIPREAVIDSASLSLFGYGREGNAPFDVEACAVQRPWAEREATWMLASASQPWAQPGCNGAPIDRAEMPSSYVMIGSFGWYTWPVRDDVQRMVSQPETNVGWLLRQSAAKPGVLSLCSSEYPAATYRPKLIITYHLPQ